MVELPIQAQEGDNRGGHFILSVCPYTLEALTRGRLRWGSHASGAVVYPGATCGFSHADNAIGYTE